MLLLRFRAFCERTPASTKELIALRAASRPERKQGEGLTCASVSTVIHWGMQGGRST